MADEGRPRARPCPVACGRRGGTGPHPTRADLEKCSFRPDPELPASLALRLALLAQGAPRARSARLGLHGLL